MISQMEGSQAVVQAVALCRPEVICAYRTGDAQTIVVALGSVVGTLDETVDAMRDAGESIGVLSIRSYRPFPLAAVRAALKDCKRVVVVEKGFSARMGGNARPRHRLPPEPRLPYPSAPIRAKSSGAARTCP